VGRAVRLVRAGLKNPIYANASELQKNCLVLDPEVPPAGVGTTRATSGQPSAPGSERVVVLGAGLWQRRYGSDPAIIGRQIALGGKPATVVGIALEEARAAATLATLPPPIARPTSGCSM
jgi:hypothetical protein